MSIQILKRELKENIIRNLYVFYGEEEYLKNYYLNRLINKANVSDEDFNLMQCDGKSITAQEISDAIEIYPMFSDKKIYIIKDLPSSNKEVLDYLKQSDYDLPEQTIIIITLQDEFKSYKDTFKNISKANGLVVDFVISSENELTEWVSRHLKSKNKFCDNKTIRYMLSLCDNKMSSLKNEIDKLANYCINEEITKKEIDEVITKSLDAKVFEITNAITSSNYDKSLVLLDNLLRQNTEEIIIASSIYSAFTKLSYIKASTHCKVPASVVIKDLGMKEYPYKLNLAIANKLNDSFITGCLKLCVESDKLLKQYKVDKKFVLYKLIGDIFLLESKHND